MACFKDLLFKYGIFLLRVYQNISSVLFTVALYYFIIKIVAEILAEFYHYKSPIVLSLSLKTEMHFSQDLQHPQCNKIEFHSGVKKCTTEQAIFLSLLQNHKHLPSFTCTNITTEFLL